MPDSADTLVGPSTLISVVDAIAPSDRLIDFDTYLPIGSFNSIALPTLGE